jgi:RimJ/RimL family protein N-acetyltransferase
MIKIRDVSEKDAEVFFELLKRTLQNYPASFQTDISQIENTSLQDVIEHLSESDGVKGFRLGGFDKTGKLVGSVRLQRRVSPKQSHCADIEQMFVDSECQNKGVGYKLLTSLIERAKRIEGLEQIELYVSSNAHAAIHLYKKLGFMESGTIPRQLKVDNKYHDYIYMYLLTNA